MKAKPTTREDLGLVPEAQVNGRHVTEGTEVTVKGAGRFRFMYQRPNGDLTVYGPVDTKGATPNGMVRSFKVTAVTKVHYKPKSRNARIDQEGDE